MLRPMWILAFGLVLVCTPAAAVPCPDDSCGKNEDQEDREASSIQLKSTQLGDRSYGAPPVLVEDLPPEPSTKDELPAGLLESDEPPLLRDDGRAHEWRKRIAFVRTVPTQNPGSGAPPSPRRTALVLFAGGLPLTRAACADDEASGVRESRVTVGALRLLMNSTKNDLPEPVRRRIAAILNARLADAIDLQLQAKQAHWNVKGPQFIALHELFDQVASSAVVSVDLIAERAVQLGATAEGTVRIVRSAAR